MSKLYLGHNVNEDIYSILLVSSCNTAAVAIPFFPQTTLKFNFIHLKKGSAYLFLLS